ncbi:MAG: hypothetical protein HY769_10220 [Candidatus Stahlbacteria bacterium]|nr:hypothetical protein [Candidatus Stahlbacteria bacterium]
MIILYILLTQQGIGLTSAYNYMLVNSLGQSEEQNIAGDFVTVQTLIAIAHASVVPLSFALEKGSPYEMQWETIIPVLASDIGGGLLGGHLGGMICRGWVSRDESDIRAFLKSFVAGLFAGVVWGGVTSASWAITTRDYSHEGKNVGYDGSLYGSVAGCVVLSSITHAIVVILRK